MKNKICLLLILLSSFSWAQYDNYQYFSKLQKPNATWHKIQLEESVLGRAKDDLSDIRIIQINGSDTIEAPYLIDRDSNKSKIKQKVKNIDFTVTNDKEAKKSYISISFKYKIPLSHLKLAIENEMDYFRQISMYASLDSISLENLEEATFIASGNLNSIDSSNFDFDDIYCSHLLLIVENKDNLPLKFKNIEAFYDEISLTARFDKTGDYFLCYGNSDANFPEYDIAYFQNKIPEKLGNLTYEILEKEIKTKEAEKIKDETTPTWLWIIVSGIVLILLIFTLRMMKTKS